VIKVSLQGHTVKLILAGIRPLVAIRTAVSTKLAILREQTKCILILTCIKFYHLVVFVVSKQVTDLGGRVPGESEGANPCPV
jgi:hypothetical protein